LFSFPVSRPALEPAQHPTQGVTGALSLGVKVPGLEADHSPPSIDEVKVGEAISPLPHTYLWCGA
jgi:hypothetical protein